jgi:hypothetical protein
MTYRVEGWKKSICTGFRTLSKPEAVIREAWHHTLDLGAERVWVYRDGVSVFTFDGMFWKKHAGDDALERAIDAENT